jgi:hypothetical protein
MKRIKYHIGKHPFTSIGVSFAAAGIVAGFAIAGAMEPRLAQASLARQQHTLAAEDVGRKCVLNRKLISECVAACSEVDGWFGWFGGPCESAARRTVLGDLGPARLRPITPETAEAELEGGPKK